MEDQGGQRGLGELGGVAVRAARDEELVGHADPARVGGQQRADGEAVERRVDGVGLVGAVQQLARDLEARALGEVAAGGDNHGLEPVGLAPLLVRGEAVARVGVDGRAVDQRDPPRAGALEVAQDRLRPRHVVVVDPPLAIGVVWDAARRHDRDSALVEGTDEPVVLQRVDDDRAVEVEVEQRVGGAGAGHEHQRVAALQRRLGRGAHELHEVGEVRQRERGARRVVRDGEPDQAGPALGEAARAWLRLVLEVGRDGADAVARSVRQPALAVERVRNRGDRHARRIGDVLDARALLHGRLGNIPRA